MLLSEAITPTQAKSVGRQLEQMHSSQPQISGSVVVSGAAQQQHRRQKPLSSLPGA